MYADPAHTIHIIPEDMLYADIAPRRLIAWGVDTVAIALITALLVPLTGFLALFFLGGLYLVISFLYRWLGLARHSATFGMRMMGLTFRDARGGPLDGLTALLHTAAYTLSVAFVFPQLVSVALMAFTRQHQGLSDIVLGTRLVNAGVLR